VNSRGGGSDNRMDPGGMRAEKPTADCILWLT